MNLGEGSYAIAAALHTGRSHVGKNYEWRVLAAVFQVLNMSRKKFARCAWLEPEFNVEHHQD
jgi:lipopolysaccharide transport system ATP-binding protein